MLDELSASLEELGSADELDGSTELLLGATLDELSASLEELGSADELDGTTELLIGTTLDELSGSLEELSGSSEELLGSTSSSGCLSSGNEQEKVNAIASTRLAVSRKPRVFHIMILDLFILNSFLLG